MGVSITVLGIAQDGGIPQASLSLSNWHSFQSGEVHHPVSLGVRTVDGKGHLFDATRSLPQQLALWQITCEASMGLVSEISDVWISHTHLSHVDGLRQFGVASMGLKGVNLRCSQLVGKEMMSNKWIEELVNDGTFELQIWNEGEIIRLDDEYSVLPILVPHRNLNSDTHAFLISYKDNKLLYLTDHDSWTETLACVGHNTPLEWFNAIGADIVMIDGTFWSSSELKNRNQDEVPHPPIVETLGLLGDRKEGDPRVIFTHINHTNPILKVSGDEYVRLKSMGWEVAQEGQNFEFY